MSQSDDWTVGQLLSWTTDFLKGKGSPSARLDAEVLLAEARGCERIRLYTDHGDVVQPPVRAVFRRLVQQRASGKPVAYLVGHREFYSMPFQVSPDVLIPRPETELLVMTVLDLVKTSTPAEPGPWKIADVGTGSGVIAVCLAKHIADCQLTAIDISPGALQVAQKNAAAHEVANQLSFLQGDLLDGLDSDQRFDLIVSNPPYVSESEFDQLAPDIRQYEPLEALVAGPDGTEIIGRLIPQAADKLAPGGWLLCELSPMIHDAVLRLAVGESRLGEAAVIKDLGGLPRVLRAQRK